MANEAMCPFQNALWLTACHPGRRLDRCQPPARGSWGAGPVPLLWSLGSQRITNSGSWAVFVQRVQSPDECARGNTSGTFKAQPTVFVSRRAQRLDARLAPQRKMALEPAREVAIAIQERRRVRWAGCSIATWAQSGTRRNRAPCDHGSALSQMNPAGNRPALTLRGVVTGGVAPRPAANERSTKSVTIALVAHSWPSAAHSAAAIRIVQHANSRTSLCWFGVIRSPNTP